MRASISLLASNISTVDLNRDPKQEQKPDPNLNQVKHGCLDTRWIRSHTECQRSLDSIYILVTHHINGVIRLGQTVLIHYAFHISVFYKLFVA